MIEKFLEQYYWKNWMITALFVVLIGRYRISLFMKRLLLLLLLLSGTAHAQTVDTAKPWSFWWWMGSAANERDITAQLEGFKKSGLGGVHISPIYGVKGYEKEFVPFLSKKWLHLLDYTVKEGKRLGLGIDITTGTGWPFGGPTVTPEMAAKTMIVKDGEMQIAPTRQKVKRAAPGGEGFVFDPFHPTAMDTYLTWFDSTLNTIDHRPRSMYNDSYEAYGANWTTDFREEFRKRRGYDLTDQLELLKDTTAANRPAQLVRMDYFQTLAELLRERYTRPWTEWSKKHGYQTRYQAHGSPGNLLDLYDEASIPETESFGTSRFPIPGLRVDPDYSIKQFGTPNPLAMKFASSAAHFSGKKLVSSETGTWLANHFKVSLSQIKPQIDELFTAGINHIFYHGTTYSPPSESYPGWLFYASTNFGPTSHFAEHFPLLNRYVENSQKLLQNSRPDNDVLVYFPIHDLWAVPGHSGGGIHLLEVHHVDQWLLKLPFGQLSEKLWQEGYAFDFVSDDQLTRLKVDKGGVLNSGSSTYKTILIPASTYLPAATLAELQRLARAGATIIFEKNAPSQVAGFVNHAPRQETFQKSLNQLTKSKTVTIAPDWRAALAAKGIRPESMGAQGLTFIRKTYQNKPLYFVANVGNEYSTGWVTTERGKYFLRYDPTTGTETPLPTRQQNGKTELYLSLLPGESCFLKATDTAPASAVAHTPTNALPLTGSWDVTFLKGKPSLPEKASVFALTSWTTFSDSAAYFSGTARYSLPFEVPAAVASQKDLVLDLGDVREVASVKINGKPVSVAWSLPFRLSIPAGTLQAGKNTLEIEVTNLSANYMRLRDTQAPEWKKFYDANIVDITYKKLDIGSWEPMPSGLLGPVRLLY
jgi:hypothetical protein